MTVRSSDGRRLGEVRSASGDGFEIDGETRLPAVSYAEVSHVHQGEVVMALSAAEVRGGVHAGGQVRGEPGAPEFSGPPTTRPTPEALRASETRKR